MTSYRNIPPRIRWGTNLANAVVFAYPLDTVQAGDTPREGSTQVQAPSGVEDAWTIGTDYVLQGDVRWIPQADVLAPRATGWDGTNGVRAFLAWARDKNTFDWHPDGRNLLRAPWLNNASYVGTNAYAGWVSAVGSVTGSITFDAGVGAWKLTATAGGGASSWLRLYQYVPCIPGETFYLSVDYITSGLVTGATAELILNALDSTPSFLATMQDVPSLPATGWTRATGGAFSTAAPANTAYVAAILQLSLPNAGSGGTVWFRNAMLRQDTTDATFVGNPGITGYLVQPMADPPPSESDGTRKFTLRLRNGSVAYDGY